MRNTYRSMNAGPSRRGLFRGIGAGAAVAGGVLLGVPALADESGAPAPPPEIKTNIDAFTAVPRGPLAIPGAFPGRVVRVRDDRCLRDDVVDAAVVREMLDAGLAELTGTTPAEAFARWFGADEVVGLKVNPVGPPVISTKPELVAAVVDWLRAGGLPARQIVVWDRFEGMLADAGYTPDSLGGVRVEGLQIMDEEGEAWRTADGRHVSEDRFDLEAFYEAPGVTGQGVAGYPDDTYYLNQHVFAGERSYFGKLVTRELTRIINLPVLKNTGHGVSVATKNLGYGAVCNTGRLHRPLFFDVCTEVTAAPWIRDKLVLNVVDAIRAQYGGGPMYDAQYVVRPRALYLATDPFALDMTCHRHVLQLRRDAAMTTDEHPRYTEYLHYGERLGLGVAAPERIELVDLDRTPAATP